MGNKRNRTCHRISEIKTALERDLVFTLVPKLILSLFLGKKRFYQGFLTKQAINGDF
jgi:hypothetical protein